MKYGKRRKMKNVEELEKPRGFDRGLPLHRILGGANQGKTNATLKFLVSWEGCDELDIMSAQEMNERVPEAVIAYYESISPINRQFDKKEKERLALALRPVIVSKVEQMLNNEAISNDEIFRTVVQEATEGEEVAEESAAMVQIPQEYEPNQSAALPSLDATSDWTVGTEE